MSAKEKLLDAFEDILIEQGESATTLDAVAKRAGVSKGGLLYHFPSKAALVDGLAGRLAALMDEDIRFMCDADEGPAAYYLHSSSSTDGAYARALIAANKLSGPETARIARVQRSGQEKILEILERQTGSSAVAQALLLIGDGLCHNSLIGGACTSARMPGLAENLQAVSRALGVAQ
ncbi:TetR/AcrR family transcriptional regulator [Trueperella pecoris]|uniref:TetR/AcrR family transcriptional regulator n=1 Tax=Trueperella pecoris TaxID=2733571 RepID=A0A7M1R1A8_9ACTO|nr:TetR/AcrR family transcriptional regulator [Trueperella pecoris]QOR47901.1 TetR/AcrR family transcriptional regulator [Trueperella pecoris]